MSDIQATYRLGGDLSVHRLGFGAMRICGPGVWGHPSDLEAAKALLRRALDLGVDLIDTADAYGPEVSEYLIAEALHPYPEGLVIATKGGLVRGGPNQWTPDGRPEHLRRACENSLRRLRMERIDLYQLHAVDDDVPFEDSLGALIDLKKEGKIRHIGLSNVRVEHIDAARRETEIVSVQNRFNLADRKHEEVLSRCDALEIAFIPWYPLATGELSEAEGALSEIAERKGATPAQVALSWLLHRSDVVLPIPGTSSPKHLEENCGAGRVALSEREMGALDAL